jgi:hypothetical protein
MSSAKEAMSQIIAQQPENATYDEILRELVIARAIQRRLEDTDAGQTVSATPVAREVVASPHQGF